jgi:hypothetical protein
MRLTLVFAEVRKSVRINIKDKGISFFQLFFTKASDIIHDL